MASIDNPQVRAFCNEQIRPLADLFSRGYKQAVGITQAFALKGLDQLIPNDDSVIVDGSETDGRTPITGHDVHEIVALATDLIAMGQGGNTKLPSVIKVSVNG